MAGMFSSARAFNGDVSGWNTASVSCIASIFNGASAFNGIELNSYARFEGPRTSQKRRGSNTSRVHGANSTSAYPTCAAGSIAQNSSSCSTLITLFNLKCLMRRLKVMSTLVE
jgi:surface protein